GLQIDKENIDCLKEKLNDFAETVDIDAYISKIRIDMVLEGDDITLANVDAIKSLEPFGMGNPTPIFGMEDMFINSKRYIGTGDKHMKIQFEKDDISYEGILFNYGANYMDKDWKNVDIAFNLDENNWMGKSTIQFIIKDMKPYKKWIKESLKENYYKYLTKALANKGNDNINLKEVNFIKKDINVIKDFLCFEKGYVLVSSKESLDELNEIFGLFEVEGNILKDTQSGVILCPCVDYIDNCSDVLVYDFLLSETDYKLIKDKGINIHHFYGDDSINKIDSFIEDISINANILEDIITTLQTSSINGRLSVIADRFNINPYQMFSAITFLRKNGIVEILSNSQEIRVSLVIENPTIEFKEDDNIMLHKIKKLRPIIEIYCKEN
ncbi:MAG: hypothetical protein RR838_10840, partial [Clostridium sp.]